MLTGSVQTLLRMLHDRYTQASILGTPSRGESVAATHTHSKITTNKARKEKKIGNLPTCNFFFFEKPLNTSLQRRQRRTEWSRKAAAGLGGSVNQHLLSASLDPGFPRD